MNSLPPDSFYMSNPLKLPMIQCPGHTRRQQEEQNYHFEFCISLKPLYLNGEYLSKRIFKGGIMEKPCRPDCFTLVWIINLYFKYRSTQVKNNLEKDGGLWENTDAKFHHNPRLQGLMGVIDFHGMTHISLTKDTQQACKCH
jgi:hypothetical protein